MGANPPRGLAHQKTALEPPKGVKNVTIKLVNNQQELGSTYIGNKELIPILGSILINPGKGDLVEAKGGFKDQNKHKRTCAHQVGSSKNPDDHKDEGKDQFPTQKGINTSIPLGNWVNLT